MIYKNLYSTSQKEGFVVYLLYLCIYIHNIYTYYTTTTTNNYLINNNKKRGGFNYV